MYGGPDGELGASMRYLSQRFSMKDDVAKGLLTDIGTEELAHLEIVGSIIHQLTKNFRQSISNTSSAALKVPQQKSKISNHISYLLCITHHPQWQARFRQSLLSITIIN